MESSFSIKNLQEQPKMANVIIETITLLCKNGLKYDKRLKIEGVLGVTIDDNAIIFLHINEIVEFGHSNYENNVKNSLLDPDKNNQCSPLTKTTDKIDNYNDNIGSNTQEDNLQIFDSLLSINNDSLNDPLNLKENEKQLKILDSRPYKTNLTSSKRQTSKEKKQQHFLNEKEIYENHLDSNLIIENSKENLEYNDCKVKLEPFNTEEIDFNKVYEEHFTNNSSLMNVLLQEEDQQLKDSSLVQSENNSNHQQQLINNHPPEIIDIEELQASVINSKNNKMNITLKSLQQHDSFIINRPNKKYSISVEDSIDSSSCISSPSKKMRTQFQYSNSNNNNNNNNNNLNNNNNNMNYNNNSQINNFNTNQRLSSNNNLSQISNTQLRYNSEKNTSEKITNAQISAASMLENKFDTYNNNNNNNLKHNRKFYNDEEKNNDESIKKKKKNSINNGSLENIIKKKKLKFDYENVNGDVTNGDETNGDDCFIDNSMMMINDENNEETTINNFIWKNSIDNGSVYFEPRSLDFDIDSDLAIQFPQLRRAVGEIDDRPYACPIEGCPHRFYHRNNVYRHRKQKH